MSLGEPTKHRFIAALNFQRVRPSAPRSIKWIVLHSTENSDRKGVAENVARWWAGETADEPPEVSAHYVVDADEVVQCVREEDVAWAAKGANAAGIQVELAGKAAQAAAEWDDDFSRRVLNRAAALVADICARRKIPVRLLGSSGLLMGLDGITTHHAVNEAFKRGDHYDPGPNFPLNAFIEQVRSHSHA